MSSFELEPGDAALIIRANGDRELAIPQHDDSELIAYSSPTALITQACMALEDAEIATMLQAKLESEIKQEAELAKENN